MWTVVKVPGTDDATVIIGGLLDQWQAGIDAHAPERVAALFTADAVFQGLQPYSVGRQGVATYYGGQPLGMTVTYRIVAARRFGADAVLGYVAAQFGYPDRDPVHVNLGVLATRTADGWRIGYYQASPAI